eukprot:CAMPEP_0174931360 /NCGR_PEP_ID=MMETSP1355-20121228/33298_1 /TAXON_ID=464990 /ORGANISM="Hemiselmis tepida, Strain CCMP443" /LENGTH=83 /DNA_ID=CAMNT_0016177707 /DNA_START=187 /DNA_END=433 /DNA_ORIENTATION=+
MTAAEDEEEFGERLALVGEEHPLAVRLARLPRGHDAPGEDGHVAPIGHALSTLLEALPEALKVADASNVGALAPLEAHVLAPT